MKAAHICEETIAQYFPAKSQATNQEPFAFC